MPVKVQFENTVCICLSNAPSISCSDSSNVRRFSNSKKTIDVFKNNMKSIFKQEYIINLKTNINDMATDIDSIISDLINVIKSCAVEKVPCNRNCLQQPWFDKECENLKREKVHLLHKFRQSSSNEDLEKNKTSRNKFKSVTREKKAHFNAYN